MALIPAFTTAEKTSHNSHKFGFTLSSTNYGYWKTLLQPFLITNKLFGYIDGTIPCPDPVIEDANKEGPSQPNPNYTTWVSNDAHVRMILLSTISESAFQYVQGTTSRDLWLALERAFAPNTISREYTLKSQLIKLRMQPDESSSAYLTRAREYADALANIGEPLKEKDLVMLVVTGLRTEYDTFKTNIMGRTTSTPFNDLHALLSDHDFMIKKTDPAPIQAFHAATDRNPNSINNNMLQSIQHMMSQLGLHVQPITAPTLSPTSQAFQASPGRGRGSWNNNNRGRGCWNNNRGNTRSSNNTNFNNNGNRGQFTWATNQNTVFGTCNRCGIGHVPSDCPNRDPSTFRPSTHSALLTIVHKPPPPHG